MSVCCHCIKSISINAFLRNRLNEKWKEISKSLLSLFITFYIKHFLSLLSYNKESVIHSTVLSIYITIIVFCQQKWKMLFTFQFSLCRFVFVSRSSKQFDSFSCPSGNGFVCFNLFFRNNVSKLKMYKIHSLGTFFGHKTNDNPKKK